MDAKDELDSLNAFAESAAWDAFALQRRVTALEAANANLLKVAKLTAHLMERQLDNRDMPAAYKRELLELAEAAIKAVEG